MSTPSPPSDITTFFPALRGYERTTTMLHPTPGDPGVRDSSIGGPLLWPADEPWPCHPYGQRTDRAPQTEPLPLIAVAQLWVRDPTASAPGNPWDRPSANRSASRSATTPSCRSSTARPPGTIRSGATPREPGDQRTALTRVLKRIRTPTG